MKLSLTLYFFLLIRACVFGQVINDSVANVLFKTNHDTLIVIKKIKYSSSSVSDYYIAAKCYNDTSRSFSEENTGFRTYSATNIPFLIDSLKRHGYSPGINISGQLTTADRTEYTKKLPFNKTIMEYSFKYTEYRMYNSDTLMTFPYDIKELLLSKEKDPITEIRKNLCNRTFLWRSAADRIIYCCGYSTFLEYEDGTEYIISTIDNKIKKQ